MSQFGNYKRASLIYNPVARGLSRHRHLLQRSIAVLESYGVDVRLVPTEAAGSAGQQARHEIEAGAELIVVAGGDGTINEAASGMLQSGVPLAILPGGTANVLAREMKLPIHLERVAQQMVNFQPHPVSVGRLSIPDTPPRAFLCMAGVGLDAEIVSRVNLNLKVRAGKLAYYVSGFSNLFAPLSEFDISVDGDRYRASFGLISRVRNYGGDLEIARNASLLRDDFEVVLFEGTDRLRFLPYLAGVAIHQAHRLKGVTIVHGRHILCSAAGPEPVYSQIDGELVGALPASFDILSGALTMLLPPAFVEREQRYVDAPVFA